MHDKIHCTVIFEVNSGECNSTIHFWAKEVSQKDARTLVVDGFEMKFDGDIVNS